MKRRSSEPHLVVRHFENLAVHVCTKAAHFMVTGCNDLITLHIQGLVAILLPGAGEIGAFRHHQAASLCPGHIKLLGDGRNGTVRGLTPDDHLCELGVDAVHKALLVGPAPITESLVVSGPGPGEHLGDGSSLMACMVQPTKSPVAFLERSFSSPILRYGSSFPRIRAHQRFKSRLSVPVPMLPNAYCLLIF